MSQELFLIFIQTEKNYQALAYENNQRNKIEFMGQRKFGFVLSGTLLIAGLLSLLINQGPKLSIDFKGGTLVSVQYNSNVEISDVKNSLKAFQ